MRGYSTLLTWVIVESLASVFGNFKITPACLQAPSIILSPVQNQPCLTPEYTPHNHSRGRRSLSLDDVRRSPRQLRVYASQHSRHRSNSSVHTSLHSDTSFAAAADVDDLCVSTFPPLPAVTYRGPWLQTQLAISITVSSTLNIASTYTSSSLSE